MKHVLTKLLAVLLLCCTLALPAFAEKPNYELNGYEYDSVADLENCIRSTFGLEGTPVRLTIRQKGDKEE